MAFLNLSKNGAHHPKIPKIKYQEQSLFFRHFGFGFGYGTSCGDSNTFSRMARPLYCDTTQNMISQLWRF